MSGFGGRIGVGVEESRWKWNRTAEVLVPFVNGWVVLQLWLWMFEVEWNDLGKTGHSWAGCEGIFMLGDDGMCV